MKTMKLFGSIFGVLFVMALQAQCDNHDMNLKEVQNALVNVFDNNMGPITMGFQTGYKIEFDGCRATVTEQANSKNKQGTPTIFSFDFQDLQGKMFKFYAVKKNTQLTMKIDKKINDSNKVKYITFEGVKDQALATTLPELIDQAQCLCAHSIN